nr:hypothetical protein SHINE37_41102 [Rhizobiaceae bacterium]
MSWRFVSQTLVYVEGHRQAIEGSFETAKKELGLDHNEAWSGAWLASPRLPRLRMMTLIRYRASDETSKKDCGC